MMNVPLSDLAESYPATGFGSATRCPICGGCSRIAHPAFNIHPDKTFRFDFRVCDRCAHGWIDPMPMQGLLNYLYCRGSYSVIGEGWSDTEAPQLTIPEQMVCANELGKVPPRRYFEMGVGKGLLYRQFLDAGWECRGVDPGAWGQKFTGVVADFGGVASSFAAEVVVALDVLEHVADPMTTLRQLRAAAAPAARVYAAMPNRMSLRALLGRERWRMLRPLGHVNFWSRRSVTIAFTECGFDIESLRKTDLWATRPIRSLRTAAHAAIEHLGLGDQWIVIAHARTS